MVQIFKVSDSHIFNFIIKYLTLNNIWLERTINSKHINHTEFYLKLANIYVYSKYKFVLNSSTFKLLHPHLFELIFQCRIATFVDTISLQSTMNLKLTKNEVIAYLKPVITSLN